MQSLGESIDALYASFRSVPKPREIIGCSCCITAEEIDVLQSTPLRALTPDSLSSYAASAFLTVGALADYLYFLPRIIEISCADDGWWPDVAITGKAIAETALEDWPQERQDAFRGVLAAVIHEALGRDEGGWRINSWICAISKMEVDVTPFLEQVAASPRSVLAYYELNSQALLKQRLDNSFWDRGDSGYQTVVAWFTSPRISAMILDGYGLTPGEG